MSENSKTNFENNSKIVKTHQVISKILKSATTSQNLEELFASIQQLLSEIINVRNFYISLYEPAKKMLNFIYHKDEKIVFDSYPAERTLNYYVIKTNKSLFADKRTKLELYKTGKIGKADPGTEAKIWLGVPLKKDDKTIGVISVQSYDNANAFTIDDLNVLELVSDTIALVIINRQNDDILKASEEKFRRLYNNTPVGLYRTTPDGKILMVNAATLKMLGYKSLVDMQQQDLENDEYPPDYPRAAFKKIMQELDELKGQESSWHRKDGTRIYVRESAKAIKDETGNVLYYDGVLEDISEKKRKELINNVLLNISQSAATISELSSLIDRIRDYLSEIIETKNFAVAIYNEDEELYTYPYYVDQNETLEEGFVEHIPRSLTEYCRKHGKTVLCDEARMEVLEAENEIELIGPKSKVWLGVPLKTSSGTIGVLYLQSYENVNAYTEDDTEILDSVAGSIAVAIEKKQTETALMESEEKFRKLFESSTDFMCVLDLKGTFTDVNPAAEKITGYSRDRIIGLNFIEYTTPKTKIKILRAFKNNLKNNKPLIDYPIEVNIEGKGIRHFECSIVPISKDGMTIGFQGSARDITHKIENKKQLLEQQDHIKVINRILRHDISNCLAIIQSALNIYNRTNNINMLEEISKQVKKGSELIGKMRQMEESNSSTKALKSYSLLKVIKNIIKNYNEIKINLQGNGFVMADEALDSVIDNIIANVIKHARATAVDIKIKEKRDVCKLTIADNGKGIPGEIKENIFFESYKSGSSGNTGLGLYIVKKTIERYGGSIAVKDNKPKGSIFELTFPSERDN